MKKKLGGGIKYRTIKWLDHYSDGTWKNKEQLAEFGKKKTICTTKGWVTYEDDDVIILSATRTSDGDWGENMCILKCCIIK